MGRRRPPLRAARADRVAERPADPTRGESPGSAGLERRPNLSTTSTVAPAPDVATIEAELRQVNAAIDALYWTFTRTARGKPPVVANPSLYERRKVLEAALKRLKGKTP
jgi:hypothetical protein